MHDHQSPSRHPIRRRATATVVTTPFNNAKA